MSTIVRNACRTVVTRKESSRHYGVTYHDDVGNEYQELAADTIVGKDAVFVIIRRTNAPRRAAWTHEVYQINELEAYEQGRMEMCGCCPDPLVYVRDYGTKRVVGYMTKRAKTASQKIAIISQQATQVTQAQ